MDETIMTQMQASAAMLFASVLLIVTMFLIARVARVRAPAALALALTPMALVLAMDVAVLPAVGLG